MTEEHSALKRREVVDIRTFFCSPRNANSISSIKSKNSDPFDLNSSVSRRNRRRVSFPLKEVVSVGKVLIEF